MMILLKKTTFFFKKNNYINNRHLTFKCFSLKAEENVSFSLSEDKLKKLYVSAKSKLREEAKNKEDPFKNKMQEIYSNISQSNEQSESSKYDLILNSQNLDDLIEQKFSVEKLSLSQIDEIYEQIQTEEIDLFEQLGTKFYEDDINVYNTDDNNKTSVEYANLSDDQEIQSIVNSSLNENNILDIDTIYKEKKIEDQHVESNLSSQNYSLFKPNMDEIELTLNKKDPKNRNNSKGKRKKVKEEKTELIQDNHLNVTEKQNEKVQLDTNYLNKLEKPKDVHNLQNIKLETQDPFKKELKIESIDNNTLKENLHNQKSKIKNSTKDEEIFQEKTRKNKANKKKVVDIITPEAESPIIFSINEHLKSLKLNEFEYYNNTEFLGNEIQDLSQFKELLENYIFDVEAKKKKVLVKNLGEFLIKNISFKMTNMNYIIKIFTKEFVHFHKENIDYLKKKIKSITRLTFVFNEKSYKGLLKQDIGGLYIFGDDEQIGSFFFNFGKVQNTKISLLFLIFQNLIIHDLMLRKSTLNIETSFVYPKKFDFDKSFSTKDVGRDYSQICLRNIIREMIKYKQSNNQVIKFYTHNRLFNKKFVNDFTYTNDEVPMGSVCFQHN